MIKKTITFTNFNDEKETEDFYFNMSKGELVKLQLSAVDQKTDGFQDKLEKLGKNLQGKEVVEVMDDFITLSYGVRSTDGKRFMKSPELVSDFKSTGAYSELLVELFREDGKGFTEFVNGLMPSDLRNAVNQEVASARERSETQMTGHQKKAEAQKSTMEVVPELPAASPVLEGTVATEHQDLSSLSKEELLARLQA